MNEERERLASLDVFRGITIAGMVLVNNPGTWSAIYSPLRHAEWHGITPTDYIFPFFLFIVGVAVPYALDRRLAAGVTRDVYRKIFIRAAAIFFTGLAMSTLPLFVVGETGIPWPLKWTATLASIASLYFLFTRQFRIAFILIGIWAAIIFAAAAIGWPIKPIDPATMRIPGVLQRIAVCYLIVSVIYLNTTWKQQAVLGVVLLLIYWLLMTAVPVPGCDVWTVDDKACNLAAWLDRTILTEAHMWRSAKVFDPEGILSTLPAIVTTMSGVLTGKWLLSPRRSDDKANGMFFAGAVLLAVGWSWSLLFPLNKSLWTSSYTIYTSGLALLTLAACFYVIDLKGYRRWAKPFEIFGVNALALFVFSGMMARLLGMIKIAEAEGRSVSLQQWLFGNLFLSWASPMNASLFYAITFILVWLFLMWLLHRNRIFIKF